MHGSMNIKKKKLNVHVSFSLFFSNKKLMFLGAFFDLSR